jgi:heme-degrading monooxygenase HmoA
MMLVERAEMLIKEGSENQFWAAMRTSGLSILKNAPGVNMVKLGQGVENPSKFMLLVEWESIDAHTAFTKMPIFAEFRALLAPYTVGGAMEHFTME